MLDLFQPGAYARAAGGNQEIPQFQSQAVKWISWSINPDNGAGGDPAVWAKARAKWDAAGIANFPWMHVRSMSHLQHLVQVGRQNLSPAIGVNIENVVGDGLVLRDVAAYLGANWANPVHMATLAWVQNGQGWKDLSFCVAALEFFPDEQQIWPGGKYDQKIADDCFTHAFSEGLTKVTPMLKTKGYSPTEYGTSFSSVCHSLYTSDDIPPTQAGWQAWAAPTPCKPLAKEPSVPLTEKQFPYTGPFVEGDRNKSSIKGLKRGLIRGKYLDQPLGSETDDFGPELTVAFKKLQRDEDISPVTGKYGRNTWLAMRSLRVPAEYPNAGQYAMDLKARAYVKEDLLHRVYPHPQGALSSICQGLHPTAGLYGNWAIDFCAPGGTQVVAVERAQIKKLSGRDPSSGADQTIGIFGWSIHYETAEGYRYFSTHYGSRAPLVVGQIVDVGQVIGTVGHWPNNPPRSHTHLGVTSPYGSTDAKKRITEISQAPRVVA